jgi:hypothetical protein
MIPKQFNYPEALISLRPGSQWVARGEDYAGIEWLDKEQTIPTEEELNAEIVRLRAEYTATFYRLERAKAYPSIGDQLDALFHAGVFPAEMAAKIQAVKDQFPK